MLHKERGRLLAGLYNLGESDAQHFLWLGVQVRGTRLRVPWGPSRVPREGSMTTTFYTQEKADRHAVMLRGGTVSRGPGYLHQYGD